MNKENDLFCQSRGYIAEYDRSSRPPRRPRAWRRRSSRTT